MRLKDLNDKVNKGVFSKQEKEEILKCLHPTESGDLVGCYPSNNLVPHFEQRWAMNYDIKTGNLVEYINKYVSPWLGAESYDEVFKTYGYTYCGIADGYKWFTNENINDTTRSNGHKPLEEATELELWKIIGMCMAYWMGLYKEWYYNK